MKRSSQVPASLIIAMATGLSVTACGPQRDCVDLTGRVLPDAACQSPGYSTGYGAGAHWIPRVESGGFGGSGSFGG